MVNKSFSLEQNGLKQWSLIILNNLRNSVSVVKKTLNIC